MNGPAAFFTRIGFPAHRRRTGAPRRAALRGLFPLLLLAALSGCAKSKVPVCVGRIAEGARVVTIYPSRDGLGVPTFVSEVDGLPVPRKKRFLDEGIDAPVRVSAGFHEVEVTIDGGRVKHYWTFGHDFKAGHNYRVGLAGPFSNHVRLRDLTAGTSQVIEGPTRL